MRTADRFVLRPPGPKIGPIQSIRLIRGDPLEFHMGVARRYGDIAYFHASRFDVYLLSHPDFVRDVLVTHSHSFMKGQALQETKRVLGEGLLTSEGGFHRRQRRLIHPLFHHQRIAGYGGTMVEHTVRAADRWSDDASLDIHREMMRLTLSIVGKTLFDTDVEDAEARRVAHDLKVVFEMFNRFLLPFARMLERLPLPAVRRFQDAKQDLDDIVFGMIRQRRATGDRGDLLSLLLAAVDDEGGGMSDQQIRDEAITIFLAGHETTANALTWTLYLLSQHPEAEALVHEEIERVLAGRLPAADDLPSLEYTRRVLTEAMRLYPPAWIMGRRATQDVEIGGYLLPADSTAVMSQYIVHHDRRWYPDPWRFDPDRWLPEEAAARPRFAYFPFGGGSRVCIGEDFAWMEALLVLATLAQRWRFRLVPGHPVELQPLVTLRPKRGMTMRLERR